MSRPTTVMDESNDRPYLYFAKTIEALISPVPFRRLEGFGRGPFPKHRVPSGYGTNPGDEVKVGQPLGVALAI